MSDATVESYAIAWALLVGGMYIQRISNCDSASGVQLVGLIVRDVSTRSSWRVVTKQVTGQRL